MNLGYQHCTPLQVCLNGCVYSCMCLGTSSYMPVPYSSRNLLSLSGNHVFHLYCSCVEDKVSWCCCCPPVPLTGFHRWVKDTLWGFNWSLTFFLNRFHHPHLYCKADLILILKKLNDLFFFMQHGNDTRLCPFLVCLFPIVTDFGLNREQTQWYSS